MLMTHLTPTNKSTMLHVLTLLMECKGTFIINLKTSTQTFNVSSKSFYFEQWLSSLQGSDDAKKFQNQQNFFIANVTLSLLMNKNLQTSFGHFFRKTF